MASEFEYPKEMYDVDKADPEAFGNVLLEMIERLETNEGWVERTAEDLEKHKKAVVNLKEHEIPKHMADTSKWEGSGYRVTVVDDLFCSIRADKKADGLEYLESIGHGEVIKSSLTILFGSSLLTIEMVKELMPLIHDFVATKATELLAKKHPDRLVSSDPELEAGHAVHGGTLKKIIKEQMAEGFILPEEIFSVYPKRTAKVKKLGK